MKTTRTVTRKLSAILAGALTLAIAIPAMANVDNGSFESGDFTSWGTYNSDGFLSVSDTLPAGFCITALPSDGITDGTYAAYYDMSGPNTLVIWQDVLVPADGIISMDLTFSNTAGLWAWTGVLDHIGPPNQHLRVDIMNPAAADLSMDPADIYMTVYESGDSSVFTVDKVPLSANISAWAGQTVRVRISKVDNQNCFPVAIDNVMATSNSGSGSASFRVTKTASDLTDGDAEVTLTCNGGLPLQQSFTITAGDPAGVLFSLTNIPANGADCTVTETGGAEGYSPTYNNGLVYSTTDCSYSVIDGGEYTCTIENSPSTFDFVVDFEWDDTAADATGSVDVNLYCVNVVNSDGSVNTSTISNGPFTAFAVTDDEFEWLAVGAVNDAEDYDGDPINPTTCWAVAGTPTDMTVEVSGCDAFVVNPGDEEVSCTMTATVFFEGIPTLSQYGMAILALLMLGIGFVGMRRFV